MVGTSEVCFQFSLVWSLIIKKATCRKVQSFNWVIKNEHKKKTEIDLKLNEKFDYHTVNFKRQKEEKTKSTIKSSTTSFFMHGPTNCYKSFLAIITKSLFLEDVSSHWLMTVIFIIHVCKPHFRLATLFPNWFNSRALNCLLNGR